MYTIYVLCLITIPLWTISAAYILRRMRRGNFWGRM